MEATEGRLQRTLRRSVYCIFAAVIAVHVAAATAIIEEELFGFRPEQLASEAYSRVVYGRSREALEFDRALNTLKEPNGLPYQPGDLWGKQIPLEDPSDWGRLFQELTFRVAAAAHAISRADLRVPRTGVAPG